MVLSGISCGVHMKGRITYTYAIVPEGNVIFLPLESNMYLLSRTYQLVQIINDRLCFCFGNADNLRDEP